MNFNVISPGTTDELLKVIAKNQSNKFRFGAGCTDLLLELKKQPDENLTVINLAHLNDNRFTSISQCDDGIRIGALVTANGILYNKELRKQYPVLFEAANRLASVQIRQVATIGGNLCTASPAGDFACALSALEAQCEIINTDGTERVIPINDYFIDVRKTDLKKDEILRGIIIPENSETAKLYSNFIKVGTRKSMEIAVVSLAYHIQADANDEITDAGVAIGSVAPTVKFVKSACEFLIGRNFSSIRSSEAEKFAARSIGICLADLRYPGFGLVS